ncbi:MAG: hypothetical protein PWP22_1464 [Thermoanaerobacter sp.]|nr:hypothetical protein [Thermoanaerobacter sp.]
MLKPLYKIDDIENKYFTYGLVTSKYRYEAIRLFLIYIHILVPEVIEELYPIMPIFNDAINKEIKLGLARHVVTEWIKLKELDEPEFLLLKEKIENWAIKYNLMESNGFYVSIALGAMLNALPFWDGIIKVDETLVKEEIGKEKILAGTEKSYIQERKKILCKYNDKFINLPEALILADDTDEEVEILSKATGNDDNFFVLEEIFPFTFTPSFDFHFWGKTPLLDEPQTYEMLYRDKDWEIFRYMPLAWDPRFKTWEEFEEQIDFLFKHYKKAYKKRTEEFFRRSGYILGKEKQEVKHFEWFVRYQIQGWSKEKIAKEYYVSRQNVTQAINDISDLIGLKPRPVSKGGRPKKVNFK